MTVCELVIEHDGYGIVFALKLVLEACNLILWDLETRPTIPLEGGGFRETTQTTDQSSRRHGHLVLALICALDGDGQTVGDKEEAALILLLPHKFCWCIGRHLCVLYVSKFVERGCRLGGCGVGGAFTKGVSHSVGQSTGVEHE